MTERRRSLQLPRPKTDFNELSNTLWNDRVIPLNQRPRQKLRVPIPLLVPHPLLPQRRHSDDFLNQLANSIRTTGMLYPPICTLDPAKKKFLIVCGNARVKSATIANLRKVEIAVMFLTPSEAFEYSISENLERNVFHPLEEGEWYSKWVGKTELQIKDVADKVNRSPSHVSNRIRLLKLPERAKELLWQNKITVWDALLILKVKDPKVQNQLAELKANGISGEELKQKISQAVLGQVVVSVETSTPTPTSVTPSPSRLTLPRRPTNRELLSQIEPTEEEHTQLCELDLAAQRLQDILEICRRSHCDACPVRDECFYSIKLAKWGGRQIPEQYQKFIKYLRQQVSTRQPGHEYAESKLRELGLEL